MINAQHVTSDLILAPTAATIATAQVTSLTVDRQGFGYVSFDVMAPAATNTSGANQPRVLTIQHASADAASSFANYKTSTTNTTAGTDDFTIAASGDTTGFYQRVNVDCRDAKRYLRVLVTPGNSTSYSDVAVVSHLSRGTGPGSATNI